MTARKTEGAAAAAGGATAVARHILETVPPVMRLIRGEMREGTGRHLTVPQFRVLAFIGREPGASVTAAAEHLGVSNATASTMVDRLVRRGLVTRTADPRERRRMELGLTPEGNNLFEIARAYTRGRLARRLSVLNERELRQLETGLVLLRRILRDDEGLEK